VAAEGQVRAYRPGVDVHRDLATIQSRGNAPTTGFLNNRTGVLFSSDCFGAPMPSFELATSSDVRAVGDEVRDLQLLLGINR